MIIDPFTLEKMIPGSGFHVLAPVLAPFDVRLLEQDTGSSVSHIFNRHKRWGVQAHSVVQIRFPANRVLLQRLPAHEGVQRFLSMENGFQPPAYLGCKQQSGTEGYMQFQRNSQCCGSRS